MKNLIYKEFKLSIHETCILFLALSFMLMIPNYPYYVVFFYTSLGIFFTCLSGRENNDILYMMLMPLRKHDIVTARFLSTVILELLQILAAIPVMILRHRVMPEPNAAGMDANIALLGLTFVMLGIFNYYFMTTYYKNPDKVGKTFGTASVITFAYIILAEGSAFVIPFMRDKLDTPDPQFLTQKLIVLAIGILIYVLLNILSYKKSVNSFEKLDL